MIFCHVTFWLSWDHSHGFLGSWRAWERSHRVRGQALGLRKLMQPLSFPLHLSFRAYLKHIPNTVFKINKKVSYFYIFSLRINVARFARYARNFGEWDFLKWFSNIVPHLETNERIFNLVFSHHYNTNTQIQVMWTTKSVFRTKCLQRKDRTLLPISFTLKSGSTWKAAPYNLSLLSHYAHFWGFLCRLHQLLSKHVS